MTINGKSWPHTEQFAFTQGDTVHWRWINPSASSHPMHLHGFYFEVQSRGDMQRDTSYAPDRRLEKLPELMLPGGTMLMKWSRIGPELALPLPFFISHLAQRRLPIRHRSTAGATRRSGHTQHRHRMGGLVLGLHVKPRYRHTRRSAAPAQTGSGSWCNPRAHFGPARVTATSYRRAASNPRDSIVIPGPCFSIATSQFELRW